jgi:predicted secreted protein
MKWMQALALAVFACACLAGCETPAADGALPPPTPAGVRLHIRAAQSGLTVPVKVGQQFAIELVGIPTAGYIWTVLEAPAFLTSAGEARGPTIAAQKRPGYAGGNHWEVFMYTAQRPGSGTVKLVQRRPWETDKPPSDTFNVTIAAN